MKIEVANVTDFFITPERKLRVQAIVEIKLAGDSQHHTVYVELEDKEAKIVEGLANQVKERLLSDPPDALI